MTHSTTLRWPDRYIILFIVSSGVGLVGGKVSSKAWIRPRAFIPKVSSILGEVDIRVLKEGWHSS